MESLRFRPCVYEKGYTFCLSRLLRSLNTNSRTLRRMKVYEITPNLSGRSKPVTKDKTGSRQNLRYEVSLSENEKVRITRNRGPIRKRVH